MKRLEAIFSLIKPVKFFADIGTDHGYIAGYAASICQKVLASDISEKCLDKARRNIAAKNVFFKAGYGLSVLQSDPDCIAICGMGGHLITDILGDYKGKARLILQPQNDIAYVREFLGKASYKITDDIPALENGKYYDIISAVLTDNKETLDKYQINFGKFYLQKNEILKEKLIKLYGKLSGYKKTHKNIEMLNMIKEVLALWQQ